MKDAYNKGRLSHLKNMKKVRGEQNGVSKLTEEKVRKIRREYKRGNITYKKLGKRYNMHFTTIGQIIRGERWAHIK